MPTWAGESSVHSEGHSLLKSKWTLITAKQMASMSERQSFFFFDHFVNMLNILEVSTEASEFAVTTAQR